jgi:hypothetical protein
MWSTTKHNNSHATQQPTYQSIDSGPRSKSSPGHLVLIYVVVE